MSERYYLTELDRPDLGSWHDTIRSAAQQAVHLIRENTDAPLWFGVARATAVEARVARVDHPHATHAEVIVPLPAPSPVPENYRSIETLDREAQALYDHEQPMGVFARAFTTDELARLGELCVINPDGSGGRGYDDEVFDALHASLDHAWRLARVSAS